MDVSTCEYSTPSCEDSTSLEDTEEHVQLCSLCKSIDFKSVFALSGAQIGRQGVAITKTRKKIDPGCVLCSFVASLIHLNTYSNPSSFDLPEPGYHFRAFDSLLPLKLRRQKARVAANPSIVVAVVRGRSDGSLKRIQLNEAVSSGLIVPVAQDFSLQTSTMSSLSYKGRIVSKSHANFNLVASWIEECNEPESDVHSRCRSRPKKRNFLSRVIDCWTRQIVPLAQDLEYLALSYVWGNKATDAATYQTLQLGYSVPLPAPQTVEDAMSVVRSLGKRYLWVDRFCMWQSENKHLQIQNMDQIYRNALTTIVAVDADSAESGLRGVSSPRRAQFRFRTDAGILVSTLPHVSLPLSSSTWVTRGWTYQEALLSRSCLFFTKDQVYFACKAHLRSEAVEQLPITHDAWVRETLGPRLMSYTDNVHFTTTSRYEQPFFYQHIKEYTSRSLSFDSDALNALKGIIASGKEHTYWGIPFTHSRRVPACWQKVSAERSECAFAQGLAWIGKRLPPGGGPIRRRKDFPTWSWTSLVDQIETNDKDDKVYLKYKHSAFHVEDKNQKQLRIADVFASALERRALVIPEYGKALLVEACVTQVCLRLTEVEGIYSIHLPYHPTHGPTSLYFSMPAVSGEALIDGGDAELLSRIESQPWNAVQLFWSGTALFPDLSNMGCWMLVDRCDPVARRIGLITPPSNASRAQASRGWLKMENLTAETRLIRIE